MKTKTVLILSFLTHLIEFKDQHFMNVVSFAKGHKIPSILFQKFSIMFSPISERYSVEKNDLLLRFVLLLTLYIR